MTDSNFPHQQLVDALFQSTPEGLSAPLPSGLLESYKPWGDGWDIAVLEWENAGEPGVILWPPSWAEYTDTEVALAFDVAKSEVTNEQRLKYARIGLDRESLDEEFFSLCPVPVQSSSGETGYICLIIEIQGQSGPAAIDSWFTRSSHLHLHAHNYFQLDDITDQMILNEWRSQ